MALTGSGIGSRQLATGRVVDIVTAGIALFILLPVPPGGPDARQLLRERRHPLSVIAGVVLTIILLGFASAAPASAIAGQRTTRSSCSCLYYGRVSVEDSSESLNWPVLSPSVAAGTPTLLSSVSCRFANGVSSG
jgi:hypothetical protein